MSLTVAKVPPLLDVNVTVAPATGSPPGYATCAWTFACFPASTVLGVGVTATSSEGSGSTVICVTRVLGKAKFVLDAVAVILTAVCVTNVGALNVLLYNPFPSSVTAVNVPPLLEVNATVAPVTGFPPG